MVPVPGVTLAEFRARVMPLPSTVAWMDPICTTSVSAAPFSLFSRNTKYHSTTATATITAASTIRPAMSFPLLRRFFFLGPVGAAGGVLPV